MWRLDLVVPGLTGERCRGCGHGTRNGIGVYELTDGAERPAAERVFFALCYRCAPQVLVALLRAQGRLPAA